MTKSDAPHTGVTGKSLYLELPETDYEQALFLQLLLADARAGGRLDSDVFIFLEHSPVFTLGRRGGTEFITAPADMFKKSGIPVIQTNRGGTITYHCPGQLVMYPIVALKKARMGVSLFVELLEEIMIQTASYFHVKAGRNSANRGVWVGPKKLGSIGLAVRQGVTCHGLAFNVNPDLEPFSWINPCGLEGVKMTSLETELATAIRTRDALPIMKENAGKLFRTKLEQMSRETLEEFKEACQKW
jgi:lipoate-protein ligase B